MSQIQKSGRRDNFTTIMKGENESIANANNRVTPNGLSAGTLCGIQDTQLIMYSNTQ